jgi:hypothetical protein
MIDIGQEKEKTMVHVKNKIDAKGVVLETGEVRVKKDKMTHSL